MRRMRAEQIRYHFGRNFLSFRGMRCFNLIRYGTYQGRWKRSGDGWRIAGHPCSAPTSPPFPPRPSPWALMVVRCVMVEGKLGTWFTVRPTPCPSLRNCCGAASKESCWEQTSGKSFYKNIFLLKVPNVRWTSFTRWGKGCAVVRKWDSVQCVHMHVFPRKCQTR